MARKPRIHYTGACYHVMLRGNGGQDIFKEDADRTKLLLLLQENVERFSCRVHAFCLMSNHIHLAIQVGEIPLSRIMQNVCFRYTRNFNRKHDVTGHLFQGRFKALLLDADNYLLELVRYIHLNPVRAGMLKLPENHPWSSHNTYCGDDDLPWVITDWILAHFSEYSIAAIRLYRTFIADGIDDGYRVEFHKGNLEGRLLGNDDFIKTAFKHANQTFKQQLSLDDILHHVCSYYAINTIS